VITEAAVREALRSVEDPELRQSIVDLHMVRRLSVVDGQVDVDIALTVAGCPLHERIRADVEAALRDLEGLAGVNIRLSVMNEEERRQAFAAAFRLAEARQQGRAAPPPPPAAPSAPRDREIPVRATAPAGPPLLDRATRTKLIGIASGKGGVGKSTVTANLAVAMSRLGHRVGLMDMDVYGFSQGRLFGVAGEPAVTDDQKIVPWSSHGVKLVSMGMFVPEDQAIIWRGPMLGKMMQQFFSDVAWGDLDFLFIDLPPGTGDVALDMAQKVHHARLVVVTTPQPVATQVAQRTATLARRTDQVILGVVENMSYLRCSHGEKLEPFGHGGGVQLARQLGVPLLGQIPLEISVREGGDNGRPIVAQDADSEAARIFLDIADTIQLMS
jgi:ATP-binding protein involved in chromosome partitioning